MDKFIIDLLELLQEWIDSSNRYEDEEDDLFRGFGVYYRCAVVDVVELLEEHGYIASSERTLSENLPAVKSEFIEKIEI